MTSTTTSMLDQFADIINNIPFNRIIGLKLDAIEADHIALTFTMKEELIGNYMHGILHGGVISSVLDMAGGAAAMAAVIQKHPQQTFTELAGTLSKSSTINMHIDFLQPGKGQHFRAKAWVLHSGTKITFTRMDLINNDDTLIATGSAAYRVG